MKAIRTLVLLLLTTAACTPVPTPAPPTPPDGSDAAMQGGCAGACAALVRVGCKEGAAATCLSTMTTVDRTAEEATPNGHPLTCAAVALVKSAADARALGIVCVVP